MFKIKLLNEISNVIYQQLSADDYMVTKDENEPDAILVRSAAMHDMQLPQSLLAIARAGAGVNNIPLDKCAKEGIVVFNTPGANANAVAELVMCGLLLASRNVIGGIEWARTLEGKEDVAKLVEKGKGQFVGPELRGKKLGVIGLGAVGAIAANTAAQGFGMEVIGYDPYISVENAWSLSRAIHRSDNLDSLLSTCDYITIHVPLTDKTKHMFNHGTFARMKNGAALLNYSRAELVESESLREALESKKLRAYVTDFPNEETLKIAGAICIPHLGASTPESEDNCASAAAAEIRDYLEYGSIIHSVNMPDMPLDRPAGYRLFVIHDNVPNMISLITSKLGEAGINILNMRNGSRKDMAITVLEMEQEPTADVIENIRTQDGVIRVRVFHR